jgi:hypothetical protein
MNLEEFEDLVDRCGERPADWPNAERQAALDFFNRSKEAQDIVAQATMLRGMFDSRESPAVPENLAERIVTLAGRMDEIRPSLGKDTSPRPPHGLGERLLYWPRLPKSFLWLIACFAAAGVGVSLLRGLL